MEEDNNDESKKKFRNKFEPKIKYIILILTGLTLFFTFKDQILDDFYKKDIKKSVSVYDREILQVNELQVLNPRAEKYMRENKNYLSATNRIYINNDSSRKILIDKVEIDVVSSSVYYESEILLLHGLYEENLIFYFVNNGNVESQDLDFNVEMSLNRIQDGENFTQNLNKGD
ncbi:hypothetical protein A5881_003604 [Enterococcus termitis]|nr:hypothetical protein A5881_003848 [Enterococcus termitis]